MSFGWDEDRVGRLISLWNSSGETAKAIADQLGCTRNAVIGKANRLGLRRGAVREEKDHHRPAWVPAVKESAPISEEIVKRMTKDEDRTDTIPTTELTSTTCRWPIGSPVRFCGHEIQKGSVYCQAHTKRAYSNSYRPRGRQDYSAKRGGA